MIGRAGSWCASRAALTSRMKVSRSVAALGIRCCPLCERLHVSASAASVFRLLCTQAAVGDSAPLRGLCAAKRSAWSCVVGKAVLRTREFALSRTAKMENDRGELCCYVARPRQTDALPPETGNRSSGCAERCCTAARSADSTVLCPRHNTIGAIASRSNHIGAIESFLQVGTA